MASFRGVSHPIPCDFLPMPILHDERCADYGTPGHPERPERVSRTVEHLRRAYPEWLRNSWACVLEFDPQLILVSAGSMATSAIRCAPSHLTLRATDRAANVGHSPRFPAPQFSKVVTATISRS